MVPHNRRFNRRIARKSTPQLAAVVLLMSAALANGATSNLKPKAAPLAPARLYDFKGVALETPLEDFRKLTHPDGKIGRVVCTGDTVIENGRSTLFSSLAISRDEAALGVTKCTWWGKVYSSLPEDTVSLKTPSDGYIFGEYSFEFIIDPRDNKSKFYKFFGTSHSNAYTAIFSALSAKFGASKTTNEAVQNGFGAHFDSKVSTWTNTLSIITVKERWLSVNKLAVMVTDNRLLKIVTDHEVNRKKEIKNEI